MPDVPSGDSDGLPYLSADEILAADDIPTLDVAVPEWGGRVRVRGFDVATVNQMRRQATIHNPRTGAERVDNDKLEALMFCAGVVDAQGAPLFTIAQYPAIQRKAAKPVSTITNAILRACGLTEDAAAAASKSGPDAPDAGA